VYFGASILRFQRSLLTPSSEQKLLPPSAGYIIYSDDEESLFL
jgi:hypothetical protein